MKTRSLCMMAVATMVAAALPLFAVADTADNPAVRDELYLVLYQPGPAWKAGLPVAEQGLQEHGNYLLRQYLEGHMLEAGPFTDDSGGAVVLRATDQAAAQALVDADPAVVAGQMVASVKPWRQVAWDYYLRRARPADEVAGPWRTENVLSAQGREPLAGQVEGLSWLEGRWVGEGLGGVAEYQFAPLSAGTIAGTFKHTRDGAVRFYEIVVIAEQDGRTAVRIKHFNPDLTGWEGADEWVEFPLLELVPGRAAYFDGLTYRLDDDGTLHAYVIPRGDGSRGDRPRGDRHERELAFRFRRG